MSAVVEETSENIIELKDSDTNFNNEKLRDELNQHFGADRKSFQFRALSRKTLSYQKRQLFVNVCCITLCPLLMVAISGIMGIVINLLINGSGNVKEYLFCSNVSAVDSTGFFLQPDDAALPKVTYGSIRSSTPNDNTEVLLTNYYVPPPGDELFAPSGAPQSCVYWFSKNYPYRQPYEPQPSISDSLRKDTTYKPDPPMGWFNASLLSFPAVMSQLQTLPHLLVRDAPGVDSGTKPQTPPLDNVTAIGNVNYSVPSEGSSGILGTVDTIYFANISGSGGQYSVRNFLPVPYFEKLGLSDEEMDDQLTQRIQDFIANIAGINKAAIAYPNASAQQKLDFFVGIAGIVANMPWGNILFDAIDNTAKQWNYTLQIGSDPRISAAASYPSAGFRRVIQQSQLSKGFLNNSTSGATITTGYRVMPQSYSSRVHIAAGAFVGGILYPFGVSFLLPIFVITLVKEKEDRILIMMEMNGLKSFAYYLTHYLHFYSLHILTSAVFIITGLVFQMEFFTLTSPGVYILLFFFWGHIQIALAFLFTVFFSKSRTALVVTFLLVLCGVIISLSTDQLFKDKAPIAYYIWPPFAFYRGLSVVNTASVSKKVRPYRISDLQGNDEVLTAIIAMIIEFFVVSLLAFYLTQIIPTEYGVPKKWHFPITDLMKKYRKGKNKDALKEVPATLEAGIPDVDPEETKFEDEDVKEERQRVLNNEFPQDSPLVMKRMRKVYPSGKLAVKDVTFAVEKSLIFGLLGPNGAGKTSLINILTGLYPPTSGSATLNQFDIHTDMDNVYMCMGVCPQHDILWDDLTVREHLLFYARLKGIPAHLESEAMKLALQQVRLEPFADRLSKGLSGGEKRRLSIAISLIGNPAVVFLDEPTTGLDPEVRRLIWNIIQDAKAGRTIVLTTHSMEEAEVLCNRIGIMAKGTLRCLGPQLRLKEVYGRGFKLSFTCRAKNVEKATAYIESLLPTSSKKLDSFVTNVSYEFETQPGLISRLFAEIEQNKKKHGVDDWGLSQTSLEEVFLQIIGEADAEAD